jgi:type I restriction enzyme S subunit
VIDYLDDFLFDGPYLLTGEDGTVITHDGRPTTQYVWGKFWVNNHAHTMTGAAISTELGYLALSRADISHAVTGAVQPKLNMGNLKQVELVLPPEHELFALERRIAPLFTLYRGIADETRKLREVREFVLPRLVTGELSVSPSYDPAVALGSSADMAAA